MRILPESASAWKTYGDMHKDLRLRGFKQGLLGGRDIVDERYLDLSTLRCWIALLGVGIPAAVGIIVSLSHLALQCAHVVDVPSFAQPTIWGTCGSLALIPAAIAGVTTVKMELHLRKEIPGGKGEEMLGKLRAAQSELQDVC